MLKSAASELKIIIQTHYQNKLSKLFHRKIFQRLDLALRRILRFFSRTLSNLHKKDANGLILFL